MRSNRGANERSDDVSPSFLDLQIPTPADMTNMLNPRVARTRTNLFLHRFGRVLSILGILAAVVGVFPLPINYLSVILIFGGLFCALSGFVITRCANKSRRRLLHSPFDNSLLITQVMAEQQRILQNDNTSAHLIASRLSSGQNERVNEVALSPSQAQAMFNPLFNNATAPREEDDEERKYSESPQENLGLTPHH